MLILSIQARTSINLIRESLSVSSLFLQVLIRLPTLSTRCYFFRLAAKISTAVVRLSRCCHVWSSWGSFLLFVWLIRTCLSFLCSLVPWCGNWLCSLIIEQLFLSIWHNHRCILSRLLMRAALSLTTKCRLLLGVAVLGVAHDVDALCDWNHARQVLLVVTALVLVMLLFRLLLMLLLLSSVVSTSWRLLLLAHAVVWQERRLLWGRHRTELVLLLVLLLVLMLLIIWAGVLSWLLSVERWEVSCSVLLDIVLTGAKFTSIVCLLWWQLSLRRKHGSLLVVLMVLLLRAIEQKDWVFLGLERWVVVRRLVRGFRNLVALSLAHSVVSWLWQLTRLLPELLLGEQNKQIVLMLLSVSLTIVSIPEWHISESAIICRNFRHIEVFHRQFIVVVDWEGRDCRAYRAEFTSLILLRSEATLPWRPSVGNWVLIIACENTVDRLFALGEVIRRNLTEGPGLNIAMSVVIV